jgi:hypothetical protein
VHGLPSLQLVKSGLGVPDEQTPVIMLQVPGFMHWFEAVHTIGVPTQTPFWHMSERVQGLTSSQVVPLGLCGLDGQMGDDPVQVASSWQTLLTPAQTVFAGAKVSGGHVAESPVQYSKTSQGPARPRQIVVDGLKVLAGQVSETPSQ